MPRSSPSSSSLTPAGAPSGKSAALAPLLPALLALALGLIYCYFSNGDFFYPDSATYLAPARSLLEGQGFADARGLPETIRTPGYPLFLLPFLALSLPGSVVAVAQHLLRAGLVFFFFTTVRRRLGAPLASIAALLLAADLPSIHYANKMLSETLFTALLFLLYLLAIELAEAPRWNLLVGAALLAGALVMVRPVAIAYSVVLAAMLFRRIGKRMTLALLILSSIIPFVWAFRNWRQTGVATVSSVAGTNMLMFRAAGALAILEDGDFHRDLLRQQNDLKAEADGDIEDALGIEDAGELPHAVLASHYSRIARRIVLEHPVASALLTIRGLLVLCFDSDWESAMITSRLHNSIVRIAFDAFGAMTFLLMAIGIAALWNRDRIVGLLTAATIGYFLCMAAGAEAEARFRVPVMPQYLIAAAAGISAIRRSCGKPKDTDLDEAGRAPNAILPPDPCLPNLSPDPLGTIRDPRALLRRTFR